MRDERPESTPQPPSRPTVADETSGSLHAVFFHRRVLRAGWGLLLFAAVSMALVAVQTLLLRSLPKLQTAPHTVLVPQDVIGDIISLVAVMLALFVVTVLEQRRVRDYGFSSRKAVGLLTAGVAAGAAVMASLVLGLRSMGVLTVQRAALLNTGSASLMVRQAAIWAGFLAVVAVAEETLFRGYLQHGLTRGFASVLRNYFGARLGVKTAFWTVGVVLALGYGALRSVNVDESAVGVAGAVALGLVFVVSLWRTGSLWWALGFHAAWDFVQSFVFGAAASGLRIRDHLWTAEASGEVWKSGGVTGPEGSVAVFAALLLAFGVVLLLPRAVVYPDLWSEAEMDAPDEAGDTLPDPDR